MLVSANESRSYSKSIAATRLNTSAVWILHICYENNAGETFGVAGSTHEGESFPGTLMKRRDLVGPRAMRIARTCIPRRLSDLNSQVIFRSTDCCSEHS